MDAVDLVKAFLRGQNQEQFGRVEAAIELYEEALSHGFDSSGPYDRLIALYSNQARHGEVARVATAALENVQTHEAKRSWYEQMRASAEKAAADVPKAAPKRSRA